MYLKAINIDAFIFTWVPQCDARAQLAHGFHIFEMQVAMPSPCMLSTGIERFNPLLCVKGFKALGWVESAI